MPEVKKNRKQESKKLKRKKGKEVEKIEIMQERMTLKSNSI